MPKGKPNSQTLATDKYQKKAGYVSKSFKLKEDIAKRFKATCESRGVSQASVITEFMKKYIGE